MDHSNHIAAKLANIETVDITHGTLPPDPSVDRFPDHALSIHLLPLISRRFARLTRLICRSKSPLEISSVSTN